MTNSQRVKKLVGLATLTALVVGLQFLSNYVSFGSISITLALIPIAMGAILYGPLAGLFLGAVMGAIVIAAPSTQAVFMPVNPAATIILCLLKTAIAGLVSGLLFKLFAFIAKKQNDVKKKKILFAAGVIVAALVVPVINTGLFIVGASIFFMDLFGNFITIIDAVITTNFLVEFLVSAILSPALVTLIKVLTRQYDLGFANDFSEFIEEDNDEMDLESVSINA
jgi:uncharacterized membrane protein